MIAAETERLRLRRLDALDALFILELVNDPDWLRFIGDKGVRTLEDARRYILDGPVASYARHGFGLFLVELREDRSPIGMCGILKRDALEIPDLGYAFLPKFRGRGFAIESASAAVRFAREKARLDRLAAIVSPDNDRSIRILEKLGFAFERMMRLAPDAAEIRLYSRGLRGEAAG